MAVAKIEEVTVNVVGSSTFGRYPKISLEKTYNMFISDEWLVNYSGFKKVIEFLEAGEGRGLYNSIRGNFLLAVESSTVYRLNSNLVPVFIGNIETSFGEVSIDENLSNQICIVDRESAYIYNYLTDTFTKQNLMFLGNLIIPSYVKYHNTFFLIGSSSLSENSQNWYAFERDTDNSIKLNTQFSIQTKPDAALAVLRLPGRGNNVLVLGSTVGEVWTQVGGAENYRRVQSFNIDSGVVATPTIAANEEIICWLSRNENNAPCIMVTDGASTKRISSDGIDFLLSEIKHPEESAAFFYRQDGHLFYQISFYNSEDNVSLIHDFTTGLFFHVSDENLNFHPARQVVFFNKDTCFISIRDASIYKMDTQFVTYDYSSNLTSVGQEIPRIRICKTVRKQNSSPFRARQFTFWIEQGVNDYLSNSDNMVCSGFLVPEDDDGFIMTQDGQMIMAQDGSCTINANRPCVDMSFSKNGNQSFSNVVRKYLNPAGHYRNRIRWHRMGQANEFTPQLRFVGFQRFVAGNGILEVY